MLLGNKVRMTLKSPPSTASDDEGWMRRALSLAEDASLRGDVPVGAVLVDTQGVEIGAGANRREADGDPTAHAELEAIRASTGVGWRREGSTMYVTLEPCPMCMGALLLARVQRLVFGAFDEKAGAARSLYRLGEDSRLNHKIVVEGGLLQAECSQQLSKFFAALRQGRSRT